MPRPHIYVTHYVTRYGRLFVTETGEDFIHSQGLIWVAHIMRRVANRIVEASDEVLPDYGIIVPSNTVSMVHLLHTRGPQTVMTIAAETVQSHPLINKYAKLLKSLGLVVTHGDVEDRRRTIVALTPLGQAQARKLMEVREDFVPAFQKLLREADADIFEPLWRLEARLAARSAADRIRDQRHAHPVRSGLAS